MSTPAVSPRPPRPRRRIVDAPGLHHWTPVELSELFYEALLRDHRSVDYTADQMRAMASRAGDSAALASLLTGPRARAGS